MSEEKLTDDLNELKEAAEEITKNSKRLVRETKRGVYLSDYRVFQDIFLTLEQSRTVVKEKLMDWEDLLPEDEDGDTVYPDLGEDGFDFTPVKFKAVLDDTTKVLKSAKIAIARFVVSLNPTEHINVKRDAKIPVMGDRNYAERLLAPYLDEDSDSSTLVPQTVQE